MPKREDEPVERIHVWLFSSDLEKLKTLFGDNMGHTKAVRVIVRKFLSQLETKAAERGGNQLKGLEVELD